MEVTLKPRVAKASYTISPEKYFLQRLGEILHFSLGYILIHYRCLEGFETETIIQRALLFYPYLSEKSKSLMVEADKILRNIIQNPTFSDLIKLVKDAKDIYTEIEIYSKDENKFYRPDFLIDRENFLIVLEFKLREEDFSEAQVEKYVLLLKDLFGPTTGIHAYLVTFLPFKIKLCKKIEPAQGFYGTERLSHTSQLPLFKELY